MCLSTVYLHASDAPEEVMRDVARIEAEGRGFWLINLFGEKKFVEGTVRIVDLVDTHEVVLDPAGQP